MTELVHVRWAEPARADEQLAALDALERERLGRLRRPEDQARFVTSRALLKHLLAGMADVPLTAVRIDSTCPDCGAAHGRPQVSHPAEAREWRVSLTHAGGRVLVAAIRGRPVGVDVEPVAAVAVGGFDRVAFSPHEIRAIQARPLSERPAARAEAWVRTEAVLKATGSGLRTDPSTVDSTAPQPGLVVRDLSVGAGYRAAVAVVTTAPIVVELDRAELRRGPRDAPAASAGRAARATGAAAR